MTQPDKKTFSSNMFYRTISILLTAVTFFSCNAQSSKDTAKAVDTSPKVAPDSLHFTAHTTEKHDDGSKAEIDTVTGYVKYYYKNGKLQMEGKVTKASPKDFRDGIWNLLNKAPVRAEQLLSDFCITSTSVFQSASVIG